METAPDAKASNELTLKRALPTEKKLIQKGTEPIADRYRVGKGWTMPMWDNLQAPWAEKKHNQPSQTENKDWDIGLVGFEVKSGIGLRVRAGFQDTVLSLLLYLRYDIIVVMRRIGTTGWHGIGHRHLPGHWHHARRRNQHEQPACQHDQHQGGLISGLPKKFHGFALFTKYGKPK